VQKYKNYSHLQAFYSPYPLPPGGAGVTSGKNQLTSGSGVSIHQETSQLVRRNTRIIAILANLQLKSRGSMSNKLSRIDLTLY